MELLTGGAFVRWSFCQGELLSVGAFVRGNFCPVELFSGGAVVLWSFCLGELLSGGATKQQHNKTTVTLFADGKAKTRLKAIG